MEGIYMHIECNNQDEFDAFINQVKTILQQRDKRNIPHEDCEKKAAVNMILMYKDSAPYVVLTKRTHIVSTHKGQISFPGGMEDVEDDHISETALRETSEEIGLKPDKNRIIGYFDDYISIHEVHITAAISVTSYPIDYIMNTDEIELILEVPLQLFIDQEYDQIQMINYRGSDHKVYFYHFEDQEIWGLTARILTDFGEMLLKEYKLP